MNYIALGNRYWRLHGETYFSPGDTHLYWCLVNTFNEKGEKNQWPDSVTLTDGSLAALAGINIKTMDAARTRLIGRGLIEVQGQGKGSRSGATYRLTYPTTSPATYPKMGEVNGEVGVELPLTSVKKGEVSSQPLQQLTQQPLQQLTQKTERSPIYIEYQTPNAQTDQTALPAGDARNDFFSSADEAKKNGQAPPPTPSSGGTKPLPIPAGKVYGDGVLQGECIAYYNQFPDEFPRSIYLPFLRYWTGIIGKGDPLKMGWERWRTMDQWDAGDRLGRWHKRELQDIAKQQHGNPASTPHQPVSDDRSGQGEIIRTNYTKQTFRRSHSSRNGRTG